MDPFSPKTVRAAYDQVATSYSVTFGDDLARLPVDRGLLHLAVDTVGAGGLAPDLGCGPGTAGSYLSERDLSVVGIDLSLKMPKAARRHNAVSAMAQADLRHLPFRSNTFALVVRYYSIQQVPRAALGAALDEISRVLTPGGTVLIATDVGDGYVLVVELLGHQFAPMGGTFYQRDEVVGRLEAAGFTIDRERQRDPLPQEHNSRRIYLLTRASAS